MPYALLQRRLEIPDLERLRRAFRGVGGMSPADAPHVARDAFGILVKQLEPEDALALQAALRREGVETDVVDHAALPELPAPKWFRRVAARESGFVGCDPYDRELTLPWDRIAVVAGGRVQNTEFTRPRSPATDFREVELPWAVGSFLDHPGLHAKLCLGSSLGMMQTSTSASTQERQVWRWTADLFLAGGAARFSLRADQIHFLDSRPQGEAERLSAFLELLRTIATHSRQALLNRVAFSLREGQTDTIAYPSRNAYQEELLWLLWRLKRVDRSG